MTSCAFESFTARLRGQCLGSPPAVPRGQRDGALDSRRLDAQHPALAARLHVRHCRRLLDARIPDHHIRKVRRGNQQLTARLTNGEVVGCINVHPVHFIANAQRLVGVGYQDPRRARYAVAPAKQAEDGLQKDQVPCKVIEAVLPQNGAACSCPANTNRVDTTDVLRQAVLQKLQEGQSCGKDSSTPGVTACSDFCTCELLQLKDADLKTCQTDSSPPNVPGYCYINAAPNEPNVGEAALVKDCSADSKRLLRFVGDTPARGAIALVACLGASLGSQ